MIEAAGWIGLGLVALILGGELLVRGASALAATMRVPPLVIGLTVVSLGTSAPELAVSIRSTLEGNAGIALGNVIGSNIFNVLLILGISALITPLTVASRLIRLDVPLMIAASAALPALGWDGSISRIDGALLFGALIAYILWSIRAGRTEGRQMQTGIAADTAPESRRPGAAWRHLALIGAGLSLLILGSRWLVSGAVTIASGFGVSELIIGLTIVAAGTSMPEVVASVVAACRGERDIAVGNVVGSNLFNLLGVLGAAGLVAPDGIAISEDTLDFDIPVMVAVAVACLPIFFTGNRIARWEGALFLFYFFVYIGFLVMEATGSRHLRTLSGVMIGFVIPLTVITIAVTGFRGFRARH